MDSNKKLLCQNNMQIEMKIRLNLYRFLESKIYSNHFKVLTQCSVMDKLFNPIQAGVFCYYIGWGAQFPPPVSPVFVVQLPSTMASQFSETKSLKGSKSQIHNDVTITSITSSLLC